MTLAVRRSSRSRRTRSRTWTPVGRGRADRADASPARLLPAGASSASAAARVTDPDTSFTEVAVASSDGSASPAIKSAAAPCRRAAMSFSSRDGAGPAPGAPPSSASAILPLTPA